MLGHFLKNIILTRLVAWKIGDSVCFMLSKAVWATNGRLMSSIPNGNLIANPTADKITRRRCTTGLRACCRVPSAPVSTAARDFVGPWTLRGTIPIPRRNNSLYKNGEFLSSRYFHQHQQLLQFLQFLQLRTRFLQPSNNHHCLQTFRPCSNTKLTLLHPLTWV